MDASTRNVAEVLVTDATLAGCVEPAAATGRICGYCEGPIPARARRDAQWCRTECRQTAFRMKHRGAFRPGGGVDRPLVFAYFDPPYPKTAKRYYAGEPDYAGEVDHAALLARIAAAPLDGWALSTSQKALRAVLPLCPYGAHVACWTKPHAASPLSHGIHNVWEPVIVYGGRRRPPGVRDHLSTHAARGGGTLAGRKPHKFCSWVFSLLGCAAGDAMIDAFPGTRIVSRAFRVLYGEPSPGAGVRLADAIRRLELEDGSIRRRDLADGSRRSAAAGDGSQHFACAGADPCCGCSRACAVCHGPDMTHAAWRAREASPLEERRIASRRRRRRDG